MNKQVWFPAFSEILIHDSMEKRHVYNVNTCLSYYIAFNDCLQEISQIGLFWILVPQISMSFCGWWNPWVCGPSSRVDLEDQFLVTASLAAS